MSSGTILQQSLVALIVKVKVEDVLKLHGVD